MVIFIRQSPPGTRAFLLHGQPKPVEVIVSLGLSQYCDQDTNLHIGPLVDVLNASVAMNLDPWKDVDVSNTVLAASGTSEIVAIRQANFEDAIQTLGLFDIA